MYRVIFFEPSRPKRWNSVETMDIDAAHFTAAALQRVGWKVIWVALRGDVEVPMDGFELAFNAWKESQ